MYHGGVLHLQGMVSCQLCNCTSRSNKALVFVQASIIYQKFTPTIIGGPLAAGTAVAWTGIGVDCVRGPTAEVPGDHFWGRPIALRATINI